MAKSKTNHNLPGSIYKNGKRWWWKVKLPGDYYDSCSYAKAVRRAINAARAEIKAKGGDPDRELPKWTPYQLRRMADYQLIESAD